MCSTTGERLARICRAIDELASGPGGRGNGDAEAAPAGSGEAAGSGGAAGSGERAAADGAGAAASDVAGRLAEIWAMIADADPELAKRLPGYLGPGWPVT